VISVAAVGPNRRRPDYSYYGDEVDMSAPGGDARDPGGAIYSAAPDSMVTTGYGTSFAAPHVAGIAALIASANSRLTAAEIRLGIESSAVALRERGMGRGLADAAAALNAIRVPPQSDALQLLNSADVATLVQRYGLLSFTARLLAARRPFVSIDQIRGTIGLTEEQYLAIAGR
jgi:serine protease